MRLVELRIDGFGILHDYHLGPSDLEGDPVVVFGPNEAGKSTLLSFIRAVLFGFKHRGEPTPQALGGGRLGGHLVFEDRLGDRYRVERTGRGRGDKFRLTLPDGRDADENVLAVRVLQNLSYAVYKNVFAFGMDELRRLENLKQDQVGAYVYGAGTGVEPGRLTAVAEQLRAEMDGLFTPLGRTVPELNRLHGEWGDVKGELRKLRDRPVLYKQLKDEQAAGEARRAVLRGSCRKARTRLAFLEKVIGAAPSRRALDEARAALEELPAVDSFPESGVQRLNALEEKVHDATVARDGYQEEMDRCRDKLDTLVSQPALRAAADAIRDLADQRSLLQNLIAEKGEAAVKVRSSREACVTAIDHLGPGWDEKRLGAMDISLVVRRQVESHRVQLDKIYARETERANNVRRWRETVERQTDLRNAARDALESHPVPKAPVETPPAVRQEMLDRLEMDTHRLHALRLEQAHLDERRADLTIRWEALTRKGGAPDAVLPRWASPAALFFVVAVAGIGMTLDPLAAVFALLIGLPVTVVMEVVRRRSRARQSRVLENREREKRELQALLTEVEQGGARLSTQTQAVEQAVREAARTALGAETATEAQIRAARRQLDVEIRARQKREALAATLTEAQSALDRAKEGLQGARRELEAVRAERTKAETAWRTRLEQAGFDPGLEPAVALSFMDAVERARALIKVRDDQVLEAADLQSRVDKLIERAHRLAGALDFPGVDTENAGQILQMMRSAVDRAEAREREKQALLAEYDRLKTLRRACERDLKHRKADIDTLLAAGGATDGEDFRRRAAIFGKRGDLLGVIRARECELSVLAGSDAERKRLDKALVTGHAGEYADELQRVRKELDDLEREQEKVDREIGGRGEQMAALETGDQLATVLQKREMIRSRFNRRAGEWRVRALALCLLEQAKEKYERERQPAVLAWASEYLRAMTADRYRRVVAPVGQTDRLEVEREDGARLGVGRLSRGTSAQLLLSVRLALARQLAETGGAGLPLILDDILVDFDGERLGGAVGVLGRVSAAQQVLLFTCHRHIVNTVGQKCPTATIINL